MSKPILFKMLPESIKCIYFIGIGGIGMSGIALILKSLGFNVQGSDISDNRNVQYLQKKGIKVFIGQKESNITDNVSVVVKSTAISKDNPEILKACSLKIPVIHRSEMLKEVMKTKENTISITGTHGKTTTTGIMQEVFQSQGIDSTIINGGIINSYNSNAHFGKSNWIIAEADESDGSFLRLPTSIGVITNIDKDHLEHYGSFENLKKSFVKFIYNIPFYGFTVVCKDNPVVKELIGDIQDRKIITYGIESSEVDFGACNIRTEALSTLYDLVINGKEVIKDISLPLLGEHNICNSLAAVAVGVQLGFAIGNIKKGLENFSGIQRRFTKVGIVDGVTVIDDYAHHPEEIRSTINSAKKAIDKKSRVISVLQPHRYSRVKALFSEFCKCLEMSDIVIITPIYSAGESKIEGIDEKKIKEGIEKNGQKEVYSVKSFDELIQRLDSIKQKGDMIICLGAGDITAWAKKLVTG